MGMLEKNDSKKKKERSELSWENFLKTAMTDRDLKEED